MNISHSFQLIPFDSVETRLKTSNTSSSPFPTSSPQGTTAILLLPSSPSSTANVSFLAAHRIPPTFSPSRLSPLKSSPPPISATLRCCRSTWKPSSGFLLPEGWCALCLQQKSASPGAVRQSREGFRMLWPRIERLRVKEKGVNHTRGGS